MAADPEMKLGDLVARFPEAARVLESHRIDYCCGGDRTLAEACQAAGIDCGAVVGEIDGAVTQTRQRDAGSEVHWQDCTLTELCDHIEQTHHNYLKTELPRLTDLIDKVVAAHGTEHPELSEVKRQFALLRAELEPHLMKEERILFPAIRVLETAGEPPRFPFGSVANPIAMMEHEHDQAGSLLKQLRATTGDYRVPDDGCSAYQALYEALEALEFDLHQHIHKENNILFPGAKKKEGAASPKGR